MLIHLAFCVIVNIVLSEVASQKIVYNLENYAEIGHHFEEFLKTFGKKYDQHEKLLRFQLFCKNLDEINRLNKLHISTIFGITRFADMDEAERSQYLGWRIPKDDDMANGNCSVLQDPSTKDAPATYNWRDKNVMSPVRNQGRCGSCWAFSATALVESRYLAKGDTLDLSEQQMVDCDRISSGCYGGLMTFGLSKIMEQGGQMMEGDYPYKATQEDCAFNPKKKLTTINSCSVYDLSGEEALKELLYKEGPLAIAIRANDWSFYNKGVFEMCNQGRLDHGVLLVGYGTENGKDYWLIKNSWGEEFGEEGYIKLLRGKNCCLIATGPPYAVVSAKI